MLERLRPPGRPADAGFSMAEVVVALMLFGILAGTVSVSLASLLRTTRDDQSRALAASMANRVIDRLHAVPASQLPQGQQPPQTFRSDGRTFSLVTTTELVSEGGGSAASSACDASGSLSARRISVVVTWSGMGAARPVRSDTLRRLSVAELDMTRGTVTTRIVDRSGSPLAGHTVTLTPGPVTYTTGAAGCAVFSGLAPGNYAVALGTTGFVDPTGDPAPTRSVTAVAGTTTRDPGFSYDRAATLAATWAIAAGDTAASYPVPLGVGLLLGHSAYTTSGSVRSFPSCPASPSCSTPVTDGAAVTGLFPSAEGYRPWVGACADATTGSTPAPLVLGAGATVSTTPAPVRVRITTTPKSAATSVTVTHAADAGCPDGLSAVVVGSTSTGTAQVGLPAGTWTFNAGSLAPKTVLLSPSTSVRSVTLP